MTDYTPNSNKYKEEQKNASERKKLDKVVKGTVKTKKNNVRKFTDIFISEDASNVKSYVLMDVLIPAVKKAISDIVTNGIDMILYGETNRSSKRGSSGYVSYRDYSERRSERRDYGRSRTSYDYDDLIYTTRSEAEEVLTRMDELIETYGMVTVADLYDLSGLSCNYTDNKYGWMSLRNADVTRAKDGWTIKLPKAVPID